MSSEPAKIRVAVRVRPLLDNEQKAGLTNTKLESIGNEVQIRDERQKKNFKFDHVLEGKSQSQVYKECEVDFLVDKVIEGYHATIFAYGQTGSGKTYTMEGEEEGLITNAIHSLFKKMHKNSTHRSFMVKCSYLQIYQEKIYDLLQPGPALKVRWSFREQFHVENLKEYTCNTPESILALFKEGVKNRVTASHKLNLSSSRSHSILEIKVKSIDLKNPDNYLSSKLELVDLAGSERISMSGAEGKQAKESIEINKALMTLRQVIAILADGHSKSIPPYRDSKLTSLLKQSIGGNSYCLMIACLAPADLFLDENISTLTYATKAAYITNIPVKYDDPKNKIIGHLKQEISELKNELEKANQHIEFLTQLVKKSELNIQQPVNLSIIEQQKQALIPDSNRVDYEVFNERLVDSINMVRELLLSNKEIREKEEAANQKCEQLRREILDLQRENFELRESFHEERQAESSPQKKNYIKKNSLIADDTGFMPEQATQFQRNLMKDSITNRNVRAISLKTQMQTQTQARALPQLKYQQQFFDEENTRDELTNFGRRTLYQRPYR